VVGVAEITDNKSRVDWERVEVIHERVYKEFWWRMAMAVKIHGKIRVWYTMGCLVLRQSSHASMTRCLHLFCRMTEQRALKNN
jgi:hypothetical protein